MKKALGILLIFSVCANVKAQSIKQAEVPSVIKENLVKSYPSVKKPKWVRDGFNFQAGFNLAKVPTYILFDAKGNIIETKINIPVSSLPANAADFLVKNVKRKKIKEAEKISDNKGGLKYEAEAENVAYWFDSEGKFIKKFAVNPDEGASDND